MSSKFTHRQVTGNGGCDGNTQYFGENGYIYWKHNNQPVYIETESEEMDKLYNTSTYCTTNKNTMSIGLNIKYNVTKVKDGSVVDNCFVLRPDKDPAARRALIEYGLATSNLKLREDILKWMKYTNEEDIILALEAYKKQIPYTLTKQDGDTGICLCGRVTEIIDGLFFCKYCGQKITK